MSVANAKTCGIFCRQTGVFVRKEGIMNTDVLIVGSGCSGLYCALNLPSDRKITIITKSKAEESDSFLAQGGICVQRDDDDFDSFMEDTLKAGHYENNRESVGIMISSSRDVIDDLIAYGVRFNKDADGNLNYTREGGHSKKRILFHKDITGREITSKLLERVKKLPNVEILEYTTMVDLITHAENETRINFDGSEKKGECFGAVVKLPDGTFDTIYADCTVLATGGVGGLYRHSTNFPHLTGDGVAVALRYGVATKDVDYVQIHPTTFYQEEKGSRSFLISESVRGEGAKLYDKNMERFVDELIPRDKLTEAIHKQMAKDGTSHVWEDMRTIPDEDLLSHFPNIIEYCRKNGYDPVKECIPVVPAQHYFMGGVEVDSNSQTSMKRLYAIGETACNGVHGKNRLASNSLLESLVFAKRAAHDLEKYDTKPGIEIDLSPANDIKPNYRKYADLDKWNKENYDLVLKEINRRREDV